MSPWSHTRGLSSEFIQKHYMSDMTYCQSLPLMADERALENGKGGRITPGAQRPAGILANPDALRFSGRFYGPL
jgi:hypothetical protein